MGLFFTERSDAPSTRLRYLARAFQWMGGSTFVAFGLFTVIGLVSALTGAGIPGQKLQIALWGLLFGASNYRIGRALARRDRWGVYAGASVLVLPNLMRLLPVTQLRVGTFGTGFTIVALAVMASVWRELSPIGDAEEQTGETPQTLTPRNRGFGEGRRKARQRELPSGQGLGQAMDHVPESKSEPELVRVPDPIKTSDPLVPP